MDDQPTSSRRWTERAGRAHAGTRSSTEHSDRVYRLAYRLTGNRHDAEDLTQEVFVRVFRSLSTYTPGTFEGWLHRITTNLFLDQARRKQRIRFDALVRRARRPAAAARCPRPTRRTPTRPSTTTSSARWPTLPPDFRAAVVLCDVEGLTYEEIAEILDAKLGTVRSRIHRGRAMLRTALAHRAPADGRARYAGPAPLRRRRRRDAARDRPPRRPASARSLDGQLSAGRGGAGLGARPRLPPAAATLVEREGWVKTRLARLSDPTADGAPRTCSGSLYDVDAWADRRRDRAPRSHAGARRSPRVGAGAVGAAVLGLLAFTGAAGRSRRAPADPPGPRVGHRGPRAEWVPRWVRATGALRRHAR